MGSSDTHAVAVVGASFIAHALSLGVAFTTGVFVPEWQKTFDAQPAVVALVSSTALAMLLFCSQIAGRVVRLPRFGARGATVLGSVAAAAGLVLASFASTIPALFLAYGLLAGIGFSHMFSPSVFIVGQWLDRRRAIGTGVAVAGAGIGQMVVAPLSEHLIQAVGWRVTMRWYALAVGVGGVCCAAVYAAPPPPTQTEPETPASPTTPTPERAPAPVETLSTGHGAAEGDGRKCDVTMGIFDASLLRDHATYARMFAGLVLLGLGYFTPFVHVVNHALNKGFTASEGALLVSIMGFASTCGRLAVGVLVDVGRLRATFLFFVALASIAASNLLLIIPAYPVMVVASAVFGAVAGAVPTLIPLSTVETLGVKHLAQGTGMLFASWAPCVLAGPPLGGLLAQSAGNYTYTFIVASIAATLGAIVHGSAALPLGARLPKVVPVSPARKSKGPVRPGAAKGPASAV